MADPRFGSWGGVLDQWSPQTQTQQDPDDTPTGDPIDSGSWSSKFEGGSGPKETIKKGKFSFDVNKSAWDSAGDNVQDQWEKSVGLPEDETDDSGPGGGGGNPWLVGGGGGGHGGGTSFDEGGMVEGESNGGVDQQGDPMDPIRKALQAGRTQMKLPTMFYGDDEGQQGFDDGGAVEGVIPQGQSGQGAPTDPRQGMLYLTGQGAIRPEIAEALERSVDPQGTMDPSQRMMAVAQRAGSNPQALFAYLQHKRQMANGHIGATQAALKQGNMGLAAHHATEAFSNIPSGHNVKFAPAPGGLAMMAQPHGGQQEQQAPQPQVQSPDEEPEEDQGAEDGGVIATDETNPSAIMQSQSKQQSYDDGGDVGDWGSDTADVSGNTDTTGGEYSPDSTAFSRWADNAPTGGQIEDRRDENPNAPEVDVFQSYSDSLNDKPSWMDKVGSKWFAEGGPVEGDEGGEEDVTGAVTQPQTLTGEQAGKVIEPGMFDKIADWGLSKFLSNTIGNIHDKGWVSGIGHSTMGEGAEAGPATKTLDRTDPMAQASDALTGGISAGMKGISNLGQQLAPAARSVRQALSVTPKQTADAGGPEEEGLPGSEDEYAAMEKAAPDKQAQVQAQAPRQLIRTPTPHPREGMQAVDAQGKPFEHEDDREEKTLKRRLDMLGRLATARGFNVTHGQGSEQREAFIDHMLKQLYGEDAIRTKADSEGKVNMQNLKGQQAMDRLQVQETGRNWRNQNSIAGRMSQTQINAITRDMTSQQHEAYANLRSVLATKPGVSPEDALEDARRYAKGIGMDPRMLRDLVHMKLFPDMYGGGISGGDHEGGQRPQQGEQEAPPAAKKYKVNPDNGKVYMYDPQKGKYTIAPGQ